ncbi:uncharacterized protein [Mytilus edulis]|uniref:uncharacterized protein n=1 Tax=Mytilus edulis TaxID=6550 RepID=UPI0039F0FEE1
MNIITLTVLSLFVTLSQAYDCVCTTEGPLHVYTIHYTKIMTQIITTTKDCLRIKASYTGGYSVVIKGEIGFVSHGGIRINKDCTSETMKDHQSISKRFFFTDMMKGMMEGMKSSMGGMMTGAEKMACYSTCGVCDCGGDCFDRQPCKLCKDLLCSKNQISYQITDKTTTKATIAPTTMFTSPSTADTQSPITVTQKASTNSPCQSSPCLNGGLCVDKDQSYLCYCQSSPLGSIINTGKRCELNLNLPKTLTTTWVHIFGK